MSISLNSNIIFTILCIKFSPINSDAETSKMAYMSPAAPHASILILLSVVSPRRIPLHSQRPSARRTEPEVEEKANSPMLSAWGSALAELLQVANGTGLGCYP